MKTIFLLLLLFFGYLAESQNWLPVKCGLRNANVNGFKSYPNDSNLYLWGSFVFDACDDTTRYNGFVVYRNNKFYGLGTEEHSFVIGLEKFNDTLFASGRFYRPNNNHPDSVDYFAKWDGTEWQPVFQPQTRKVAFKKSFVEDNYIIGTYGGSGAYDSVYTYGVFRFKNNLFEPVIWTDTDLGNHSINDIKRYQGDLYVGGTIQNDSIGYQAMAKVDSANHFLSAFAPPFEDTFGDAVFAMAEFQGKLYFGGEFHGPSAFPDNYAVYSWDGTNFETVAKTSLWGHVSDFLVTDSFLYAVGDFDYINGVPASKIARYDGQQWEAFTNDVFNYQVDKIYVFQDTLFISGMFFEINGVPFENLAKFNTPFSVLNTREYGKKNTVLNLFPTPCNQNITIQGAEIPFHFEMKNLQGQTVVKGNSSSNQLDTSQLLPGCYVLNLNNRTGRHSAKIIKLSY
jgi:hypothetical protein